MLALAVIFNNYFHDMATGVLLGSAAVMWALGNRAERRETRGSWEALAEIYGFVSKVGLGALVWIVVGGIPRVIFFTRFEWDPAVVRGLVPALVFKHALFFSAVVVGVLLWMRVKRKIDEHAQAVAAGAALE